MLDEADHMADLGFLPGVKRLLDRTPAGTASGCCSRRRSTTASTCSCKRYLATRSVHSVDPAVAPVADHDAPRVSDVGSPTSPLSCASSPRAMTASLLFTRTKHGAKKLAKQLTQVGHPGRRTARQPVAERPRAEPRRVLRRARPRCWSPPTSRPAASTSTTSRSSSTSTRRPSTRRTSTARAVRLAPAPTAWSSRS